MGGHGVESFVTLVHGEDGRTASGVGPWWLLVALACVGKATVSSGHARGCRAMFNGRVQTPKSGAVILHAAGRKRKLPKKTEEFTRKTEMTLKHKLSKSGTATSLALTEALIKIQELELQATENRSKVHQVTDSVDTIMAEYKKLRVLGLNDKELDEAERNIRGRVEHMFDSFEEKHNMGLSTLESVKEGLQLTQKPSTPLTGARGTQDDGGIGDPDDAMQQMLQGAKKAEDTKKRIEERLKESQNHLAKARLEEESARREVAQLMIQLTNSKAEIRRVWTESQEKLNELKEIKSRNAYLEQQGKRFEENIKKLKEAHTNATRNMEEELKLMESSRKQLREKLDSVEVLTNQLERQRDDALAKVAAAEAKLAQELEERKKKEANSLAEQKELKGQIKSLQKQLSTVESEATTLREKVFQTEKAMEEAVAVAKHEAKIKMDKLVAEKEEEHARAQKALQAEWAAKIDEEVEKSKTLVKDMEAKIQAEIDKATAIEKEAEQREKKLLADAEKAAEEMRAKHEGDMQAEHAEKEALRKQAEDTEALLEKTKREQGEVGEKLKELKVEYANQAAQLEETTKQLEHVGRESAAAQEAHKNQVEELESTIAQLKTELQNNEANSASASAALQVELDTLKSQLADSTAAGSEQNEAIEKMKLELESSQKDLLSLNESMSSALGSSGAKLQEQEVRFQNEIAVLKEEYERKLETMQTEMAASTRASQESNTLQATIDAVNNEKDALEELIDKMADTEQSLRDEIERLQAREPEIRIEKVVEEKIVVQPVPNETETAKPAVVLETTSMQTDPLLPTGPNKQEMEELLAERDYFRSKFQQSESTLEQQSAALKKYEHDLEQERAANKMLLDEIKNNAGAAIDPAVLAKMASMNAASQASSKKTEQELEQLKKQFDSITKERDSSNRELKKRTQSMTDMASRMKSMQTMTKEAVEEMILERMKESRRRLAKQIMRFTVLTFKQAETMLKLDDERAIVEHLKSKNKERKQQEVTFLSSIADAADQCRVIAKKSGSNDKLKSSDHQLLSIKMSQRLLRILQLIQERGINIKTDDDVKVIEAQRQELEKGDVASHAMQQASTEQTRSERTASMSHDLGENVEEKALLLLKKRFGVKFARKSVRRSSTSGGPLSIVENKDVRTSPARSRERPHQKRRKKATPKGGASGMSKRDSSGAPIPETLPPLEEAFDVTKVQAFDVQRQPWSTTSTAGAVTPNGNVYDTVAYKSPSQLKHEKALQQKQSTRRRSVGKDIGNGAYHKRRNLPEHGGMLPTLSTDGPRRSQELLRFDDFPTPDEVGPFQPTGVFEDAFNESMPPLATKSPQQKRSVPPRMKPSELFNRQAKYQGKDYRAGRDLPFTPEMRINSTTK